MRGLYFDELQVGGTYKTGGITITEDSIIEFALKYDPQYFHIDREAAKKSIFEELVASGFQIYALSFRVIYDSGFLLHNLGGNAADELRWLKTVKAGDTLSVNMEVIELRPLSSRPDRGLVRMKYVAVNQLDEPVLSYLMPHFFKRKTDAPAGE
jgi:acyl dehydratase